MNLPAKERIAFDVQTERILQILSSEIYDSPNAFLRENVQNAYDAVLMRCTAKSLPIEERRIEICIAGQTLTVRDDGIGMSDEVLKQNFWKAGSSGKKSELAQRSGVIGTFGIGAMANFGVCESLRVETRYMESRTTLVSSVQRSDLQIAQECIDLERLEDEREPGTLVVAKLDPKFQIDTAAICGYLSQYVRFLPVPLTVNGKLISQEKFEGTLGDRTSGFSQVGSRRIKQDPFEGLVSTFVDAQARVLIRCESLTLSGNPIPGQIFMVQNGGQTLAFRNLFGLAPVPISGWYQLGGFVNLGILHPTAGREALSRESVQHVGTLVQMMEWEASQAISRIDAADRNQAFQQYILAHSQIELAGNVTINALPARVDIPLSLTPRYEEGKDRHFYAGQDATVLQRFGNEQANLFHVSQGNPRRNLQLQYLSRIAKVEQVPEKVIVDLVPASQLTFDEAVFLVRVRGVLMDEYFMPDVELCFAAISHGVALHVETFDGRLRIAIAHGMPAARMVVEAYRTAREVFQGFVIDFVRQQLYQSIREHVPSSTLQGRDALYQRLKQNEEVFRYEKADFGEVEAILADYLAGKIEMEQVLKVSGSAGGYGMGHRQEVRSDQIGTVEKELPSILVASRDSAVTNEYQAAPPIMRTDIITEMKVLTVTSLIPKLNSFQMFLAVSDRLKQTDGEFLCQPHTTKVMWGSHRVIYVFSDASGQLSLYYDIKLRDPLELETTGGAMFPTTTIVTGNRIFVPVPSQLESAFMIVDVPKEFFVRFDTIP